MKIYACQRRCLEHVKCIWRRASNLSLWNTVSAFNFAVVLISRNSRWPLNREFKTTANIPLYLVLYYRIASTANLNPREKVRFSPTAKYNHREIKCTYSTCKPLASWVPSSIGEKIYNSCTCIFHLKLVAKKHTHGIVLNWDRNLDNTNVFVKNLILYWTLVWGDHSSLQKPLCTVHELVQVWCR